MFRYFLKSINLLVGNSVKMIKDLTSNYTCFS